MAVPLVPSAAVQRPPTGTTAQALDARLIRYRNRPASEDAVKLAEDLLTANRAEDAVEVAGAALERAPDDGPLLLVVGKAWLKQGDLLRAQASLLKAARVLPHNKDVFRWLGEVLLKRGDPDRAAKVLERAVALDASDKSLAQLHQRAVRLAKIARTGGEPSRVAPLPTAPDELEDETTAMINAAPVPVPRDVRAPEAPLAPPAPLEVPDDATISISAEPVDDPFSDDVRTTASASAFESTDDAPLAEESTRVDEIEESGTDVQTVPGSLRDAGLRSPAAKSKWDEPSVPRSSPFDEDLPTSLIVRADVPGVRAIGGPVVSSAPIVHAVERAVVPTRQEGPPAPMAPPPRFEPPPEPARPSRRARPSERDLDREARDVPRSPSEPVGSLPPHAAHELIDSAVPAPAPDVSAGSHYGLPEDVDGVLRLLERQGLFEAPNPQPMAWASRADIAKSGMRIGRVVAVAWGLAVLLAAGAYAGWHQYVQHRRAESARLVQQARGEAFVGDHESLVDAERHLLLARDLDPKAPAVPTQLLFVQAQRALEDGAFQAGYLRPTLERGARLGAEAAYVKAATAVLAAAEGDTQAARQGVLDAVAAAPNDAAVLYLAGRVEQRLGVDTALDRLSAAVEKDASLAAAAIALAEAKADEGNRQEALELLDRVLARKATHLRAKLWRTFLSADDADPAAALTEVHSLAERLDRGAPTDRVLTELSRARLLRRQGNSAEATTAVDRAIQAGASEPRLLALVALEAKGVGSLARAQQAAMQAVAGAATNPDFRKLLASILLDRRNGLQALRTLAPLDAGDPEVLVMRARAALLVATDEVLRETSTALAQFLEAHAADATVELKSLAVRARVRLGEGATALPDARALAAAAPGDPHASMALGEAALAAKDAATARPALESLVRASPDLAEGHFLLGRAQRMSGQGPEAESSLRRALELAPEHTDARTALGGLLLDLGKFAEADEVYQQLARQTGVAGGTATSLVGRLGRVEALIGLGRVDDARVQLEAIRADDRGLAVVQTTTARLAIARSRPGEAVTVLAPLASGDRKSAEILALYGDALLAAQQFDAAGQAYLDALTLDATLPEALLGRAAVAIHAENARDALDYLTRAEEALAGRIRPPALGARRLLLVGKLHLLDPRHGADAARAALRAASAIPGAPAEVFFLLGESLAGANTPEARQAYARYLQLAPTGEFADRARRAIGPTGAAP